MTLRSTIAFLVSLGACACGGSGGGGGGGGGGPTPLTLTNFQAAGDLLGQSLATGAVANNGAGDGFPNASGLDQPMGHVGTGSLYVCDPGNHRVLGWNSAPTGFGPAADFVIGQVNFTSGSPGISSMALNNPSSCWVSAGTLFVADTSNGRVLLYGGPPTSNVAAVVALGKPDLTTPGVTNGQSGLGFPTDVCVAANRIVVPDSILNRVLVWNGIPGASGANAQVVLGQPDFITYTAGITPTKMNAPAGVWTDGTRLVVADRGNHRVLVWTTFPTTNGQAPDLVVGQPDLVTNSSGNGTQKFLNPWSVASDGVQLFVADRGNNRVLIFDPFPTASNPAAARVLGQNGFTNVTANDDDQDGAQDLTPTARTMAAPTGVTAVGNRLYVSDIGNHRVLLFTGS